MEPNPWKVTSIQDFSCLKCPECDFYTKEENYFENHAISNHPLSSVLFGIFVDLLDEPDKVSILQETKESMENKKSEQVFENGEEAVKIKKNFKL